MLDGFNPRARMGRDIEVVDTNYNNKTVSTHAPAWGATGRYRRVHLGRRVSTHAPAWGATG